MASCTESSEEESEVRLMPPDLFLKETPCGSILANDHFL